MNKNGSRKNLVIGSILFVGFFLLYVVIGHRIGSKSSMLSVWCDAFFSFDNGYYLLYFFSDTDMPLAQSIFRHPFLYWFMSSMTRTFFLIGTERIVLWEFIVFIQCALASVSVVLIYLTCLKISNRVIPSIVLAVFYGFSSTMLIIAWTPESFVYASFTFALLVYISYAYIEGKKAPKIGFSLQNIVLAFVITGITLTNSFIWFVASWMSYRNRKEKLIWTGSITCAVIAVFFWTMDFSEQSLMEMLKVSSNLTGDSGFHSEFIVSNGKALFHHLLGSTVLFGETIIKPLRTNEIFNYPSFNLLPEHNWIETSSLIVLYIVVGYSIIRNFKKHAFVRFLTIALVFNLFLHGVLEFGLLEAFIYGAHFVFILSLLLAYLFRERYGNLHFVWLVPFILLMIVTNIQVVIELYRFAVENYPPKG
jgi:Family of unknown function (DUF6080)